MGFFSKLNPFSNKGTLSVRGIDTRIMRKTGKALGGRADYYLGRGADLNRDAFKRENLYGAAAVVAAYFGQFGLAASIANAGVQDKYARDAMEQADEALNIQKAAFEANKPRQAGRSPAYQGGRDNALGFGGGGSRGGTLLTGPSGVSASTLNLGRTSILGG